MSETILDDFRPTEKSYYATKAYRLFWWSTAFFMILVLLTIIFPPSEKQEEVVNLFSGLAFILNFIIGLVGLGYGIRSFIKKESSNKKYIGTIGNLFFVGVFGLIILSDIKGLIQVLSD